MAKIEAYKDDAPQKIKRNHGSTTFFLFLDYLFLIIFFAFLFYILYKFFTV